MTFYHSYGNELIIGFKQYIWSVSQYLDGKVP